MSFQNWSPKVNRGPLVSSVMHHGLLFELDIGNLCTVYLDYRFDIIK
jgi:hypothetical protein